MPQRAERHQRCKEATYRTALDANFMQIDEVRFAEDMKPLGLTWVKLGLNDVLYDPKTRQIYTPNTDKTSVMGENALPEQGHDATMEARAKGYNPYRDKASGRFTTGPGSVRMGKKEYVRLCHQILTDHPSLPEGATVYNYFNRNHYYRFSVKAPGSYVFHDKMKIEGNETRIARIRKGAVDP